MKHTTGPRRGRPRGNGKRFSSGKNQTFESTGPEVKIRGTAQQVYEKYLSLARDAQSAGDRIAAEGYFQFADHYFRVVTAANGNNQARPDRNNSIPPAPESAAAQIVVDDTETGESGVTVTDASDAEDAVPESVEEKPAPEAVSDAQPTQRQGGERLRRRSRRVAEKESNAEPAVERFADEVKGAEPAAQAEELAQALSRVDGVDEAPSTEGEAGEAEDAPKRRRRSPLGMGRKRPAGRPRKAAEAAEADVAKPDEGSGDDSGVVKTVRRGARKTPAAKSTGTAAENV